MMTPIKEQFDEEGSTMTGDDNLSEMTPQGDLYDTVADRFQQQWYSAGPATMN